MEEAESLKLIARNKTFVVSVTREEEVKIGKDTQSPQNDSVFETMAYLVGTCLHMCPEREQQRRERERRLHQFEVLPSTDGAKRPRADPERTIKEFQRPAAGSKRAEAEDVRPPHVLKETTTYLMTRILPREDVPWIVVYDFIFDRLRAIRQDITLQQCWGPETVCVYEEAIRFYIYAEFRLCEEPLAAFDPHINSIHLQECLKQLIPLYKICELDANSSEVVAFYLLHNLDSADALTFALSLPQHTRKQPYVISAIEVSIAWMRNNYVRVLRQIAALSFLQGCCVMRHLSKIRRHAFLVMSVAYSSSILKYPLKDLTDLLLLESKAQTKMVCQYYGVQLDGLFVKFSKKDFCTDKQMLHSHQYGFLKEKGQNIDIVGLITGSAIASKQGTQKNS